MGKRSYAEVPYPWRAAVDLSASAPGRHYEAVIRQALRYGLPASRRLGPLWALAGRRGLPTSLVSVALRLSPRRARPDLDALRGEVVRGWPTLAAALASLPPEPPPLALLALERRAALTVFCFHPDSRPLLVLKVPAPGDPRADQEAQALREAEPASVAPRELGRAGPARVQEALPGAPLELEPLTPASAATLAWPASLEELAAGLTRLAGATVKPEAPEQLSYPVRRSLEYDGLGPHARTLVSAAARDLDRLNRSVLEHRDASPQNCLFADGALSGLVDWENARSRGGPGLDVWNAALTYLEAGVGLRRWSAQRVEDAFRNAWRDAPFYAGARNAARRAARAAEVPESLLDPLELAFFARRLGRRMDNPGGYPSGPRIAARMLELACLE
jgi:hypothetical protein